jgi:hypothetical protein
MVHDDRHYDRPIKETRMGETKFLPSQIPKSQSIINRHAAACWAGISKHEK